MRRYFLPIATFLACSLSAGATTISYTGSGQFSNITNCNAGLFPCTISSDGGQNNVLGMSGYSGFFGPPSTLTAVTTSKSFDLTSPTSGVVLGELDWTNRSTSSTDSNFNVTYTFALSFSSPDSTSDSQAFSLNIQQTANPNGDEVLKLSDATLDGLGPFALDGVSMSNLRFVLGTGSAGAYNGSNWTNPEDSTSRMLIEADFSPNSVTPEPSSIALLGTGLLGVAGMLKRRFA